MFSILINSMIKNGKIFYELCLIPTERCNLNCTYCLVNKTAGHSMSFDTAREQIDRMMHERGDFAGYEVSFMGGEPFLAFPLIKKVVEYCHETYGRKAIRFSTVTNGTLVHREIQQWLVDHRDCFFPTVSVDGEKATHDAHRCGSFDRIDLDFFASYEAPVANMVVSPLSLSALEENVKFLESRGFYVKTFLEEGTGWRNEHLPLFADSLMRLITYYLEKPEAMPTTMLSNSLYLLMDEDKPMACEKEAYSYAVDTFGNRYDCHRCMPFEQNPDLPIPAKYINNLGRVKYINDACRYCFISYMCNACPASNAARIERPELADVYCRQRKVLYRAQAYFYLMALDSGKNHRFINRMSGNKLRKTVEAAKIILQTIDSAHSF